MWIVFHIGSGGIGKSRGSVFIRDGIIIAGDELMGTSIADASDRLAAVGVGICGVVVVVS